MEAVSQQALAAPNAVPHARSLRRETAHIRHIPPHRELQALSDGMGRFVAEQLARFGNVGEAMPNVASSERTVFEPDFDKMRVVRCEQASDFGIQIVESRSFADRNVIDSVDGLTIVGRRREQIRLHDVGDVNKSRGWFPRRR
jgi:hypothetical protein